MPLSQPLNLRLEIFDLCFELFNLRLALRRRSRELNLVLVPFSLALGPLLRSSGALFLQLNLPLRREPGAFGFARLEPRLEIGLPRLELGLPLRHDPP